MMADIGWIFVNELEFLPAPISIRTMIFMILSD